MKQTKESISGAYLPSSSIEHCQQINDDHDENRSRPEDRNQRHEHHGPGCEESTETPIKYTDPKPVPEAEDLGLRITVVIGLQSHLIVVQDVEPEAEVDVQSQQYLGRHSEYPEVAEGVDGPINKHQIISTN